MLENSSYDPGRNEAGQAGRIVTLANARWIVRCQATTLSNNLRVARLTNCQSILLWMTANFPRRNCATAGPSRMRIDQPR